jgi:hypothetical protein
VSVYLLDVHVGRVVYVFIGLKVDELCLLLGLSEVFGTSLKTDWRKYRALKVLEFEGLTPL